MDLIGGFTQDELNEIWNSHDTKKPDATSERMVNDDVEQVMNINTTNGQVSVRRRKPEDAWEEM